MSCLYTKEEIIQFIKDIDLQLNDGITRSDLDTGQGKHSFSQSNRQLERSREKWLAMLKQIDPACYYSFMPPSAIQFKGGQC